MKKLGIVSFLSVFIASSLVMFATSAWAVPVFARKYSVQCSLCHTLPPRLTKVGVAFKENGFEMPSPLPESELFGNVRLSDDAIVPAGFPSALRTGIDLLLVQPAPAPGTQNNVTVKLREFGMIGGGNIGGIGFWFDAPSFVFGALNLDFKFNDMAKIKVGLFEPASTINYGLGLQPAAFRANPVANFGAGQVVFGGVKDPAIEVRGTTDAINGMGINYAIGYVMDPLPNIATASGTATSIYGGVGYMFENINTNLGLSYASSSNIGNVLNQNGTTLLVTATYNVGNPFQVILAYNSTQVGNPSVTTNGYSIQPEYSTDKYWLAARYTNLEDNLGVQNTTFDVGVAYRFLLNVIGSVNYLSDTKAGVTTNSVTASIDLIL